MHGSELMGFTAAISAAASSGLLALVIDGPPRTAAAYAKALSLDPRATALVLDVLVAFELSTRDGEAIGASPALRELAQAPGGMARTIAMWSHVPEFVRTGRPFLRMDSGREEAYANVVVELGKMFHPAARKLADELALSATKVLDIGCGSGVWGLAFAERDAATHVTGSDLPAVLEAFRARATTLGLSDRVATIPGDIHELALPRTFELVIVANVLRIEAPDRARAIVHRAASAIQPGGKLLIVDALSTGTPARDQARAVYALHLGMRTDQGRVYSRAEINAWIAETGLRELRAIDLESRPGAVGAILAG